MGDIEQWDAQTLYVRQSQVTLACNDFPEADSLHINEVGYDDVHV